MRRELLPERPFRFEKRNRRKIIVLLVLFVLVIPFGLLFAVDGLDELRQMKREQAVWETGESCVDGDVRIEGERSANSATVTIHCTTQDGRKLTQKEQVAIAVPRTRDLGQVEIRYAPDTGVLAVETVIDARKEREIKATLMIVGSILGILVGTVIIGVFIAHMIRRRRTVRRGSEITVEIERVVSIRRGVYETHVRKVYWKLPGHTKTRMTKMDVKTGLAWIDAAQMRALAMIAPNGKFGILLAGNLDPLELTDEERAAVTAKLEANGGGITRGLEGELRGRVIATPPAA